MAMKVIRVATAKDQKRFANLPYQLYQDQRYWVPPLRDTVNKSLDPKFNKMLRRCDYQLFLLVDGNKVLGRVSAFVDHKAVKHWAKQSGKRTGLFGDFECIEDEVAAARLLKSAETYLVGKRCQRMRGPWSIVAQDWGLVASGHKPCPVVNAPYNAPFYGDLLTSCGLTKATDLLVYEADVRAGFSHSERALQLTDTAMRRQEITIRRFDPSRAQDELELLRNIEKRAHSDGWGFAPTLVRATRVLHQSSAMIHIAEDKDGRGIGFSLVVPDDNVLLRGGTGNRFPTLWWKLATKRPTIRNYRMWELAILPEFKGKSIESVLWRHTFEALEERSPRIEINYLLEDNKTTCNAIERMGLQEIRRYRVYEKVL